MATEFEGRRNNFTFIDLFAGVGGFRLAAEQNGGECVFSSEWDKDSAKTYEFNHGARPAGDITKILSKEIPDFDLLCAGFPCQPFSIIGQRAGFEHPTQGTLFFDVLRILKEKSPQAFILENVEGLLSHDKGKTFKIIIESLEEIGYKTYWKKLDAKDFGLPQRRVRVFIVGFNSSDHAAPKGFSFPPKWGRVVPIGPFVEYGAKGYSVSEALQKYLFKLDDGQPQVIDRQTQDVAKTLVASYYKVQRKTGTFVRDLGSETGIRLLTEFECKSMMGFPASFVFPVSRTQMYRQMGNSVAVNVVDALIRQIAMELDW